MGECGCSDFRGDYRFRGPGDLTYVLQVYESCDDCCTPAGVVLYAMNPDECRDWDVESIPEIQVPYVGRLVAVLDPKILGPAMARELGEEEDAIQEALRAFRGAVYDTMQADRKNHA